MLVYMCACRLRLCVRSGLRLRLTHQLSRPPPHHHALPVEDAAGALVISRAGAGCSGERRPTLGGRLAGPGPTGLAGPRLWGGGPLGSGPRARPLWGGRLPVEPAGLPPRTLGRLHCGCRRSRLRALLCPFLGGDRGCPCGGSPGGPVPLGVSDVWGPGLFRACFMPCGMGLLFPTHTIKHLQEEPYEHKRAHTHKCTLKHSHWYKNRCSQTHIV